MIRIDITAAFDVVAALLLSAKVVKTDGLARGPPSR
jgi:hypothetical protein